LFINILNKQFLKLSTFFAIIVDMKMLLASLLVMFLFSSCGKMKEPEFRRIENFGIKKLGIKETTIGFNLTWFNPNNFGVAVKEAAFDVYLDSVYLGKFIQPNPVSVNSNGEFSIPIEGTVSLLTALQFDIPKLVGKVVHVQANGNVMVGKAGIFMKKELNYKGNHKLDSDLMKNPAAAGSVN
jgi:LEA14-like dessication related protein